MKNDKMYIELNKDKIIKEQKCDYNKMVSAIDDICFDENLRKTPDGWYTNGDFTSIGRVIAVLSRQDWFLDNINSWLWYQDDEEATEDIASVFINGVAKYVETTSGK